MRHVGRCCVPFTLCILVIACVDGVGRKQNKTDRTRRGWTDRDESFLLATLKELVATGWKSDNVLARSGVGFNVHNDYKIDCDEEQWDQIIKADNSARLLRNKAWPLYNDWKIVFGKDSATGDEDRDTSNIPNEFGSGPPSTNPGRGSPLIVSHEDLFGEDPGADNGPPNAAGESINNSGRESQSTTHSAKKRKMVDPIEGLVDVMAKMHDDTNTHLEHLASRISYEFDVEKAQKQLFELIGVIPGLTLGQVFDATGVILEKIERLNYFMSLPPGAREAYVWRALEKYNN
ncbi:hypothetical protein SASPL_104370 [Salvia splendens]|uniref:Myb/SANT-like domain-containing protein n=1 Tax=Salvia splendens TaxID=180675 RepID=A0A8X8YNG4_SALSN|nr:hypothetical protein SASPL_104370 [Salvia splendens]